VFLPMSLAPGWLEGLSRANPLTYLVDASRALFTGKFGDSDVLSGIIVTAVFTALLAWWGTRTFQRTSS
ncbi:MAG: Multidrug transporter permease, partial [Pseudonocardiales bacterium]|nr:Multidrug transporter permease [Pseudonocardiales bacterium]